MILPDGAIALTTIEEIKAAWGEIFIQEVDGEIVSPIGEISIVDKKPAIKLHPWLAVTPDAVYVEVSKPIRSGPDIELSNVVKIVEPNVSNLKAGDRHAGDMAKVSAILASVCSIPTADVDAIRITDFNRLTMVMSAFLDQ